jgi:hypothetical protein
MKRTLLAFILVFFTLKSFCQNCYPSHKLPKNIVQLTNFGQRAECSLDGQTVYFLDKPGGQVWAVNINTKLVTQLTYSTNKPQGYGYYRVLCLADGNLLLCGGSERHVLQMEVLHKSFKKVPEVIPSVLLDEGPAVSRKTMKIAWTTPGQTAMYWGTLAYKKGKPYFKTKTFIADTTSITDQEGIKYTDILETQNWRGKNETELIFAQYSRGKAFRCEVMGLNLPSGAIINYSKAPNYYDEPEGIFPNQQYILVESDRHLPTTGTSTIDIYKLALDGTGKNIERLTHFADTPGFRSSNPVVSDNGRFMVFQGSYAGSEAGGGCGIYLMEF